MLFKKRELWCITLAFTFLVNNMNAIPSFSACWQQSRVPSMPVAKNWMLNKKELFEIAKSISIVYFNILFLFLQSFSLLSFFKLYSDCNCCKLSLNFYHLPQLHIFWRTFSHDWPFSKYISILLLKYVWFFSDKKQWRI